MYVIWPKENNVKMSTEWKTMHKESLCKFLISITWEFCIIYSSSIFQGTPCHQLKKIPSCHVHHLTNNSKCQNDIHPNLVCNINGIKNFVVNFTINIYSSYWLRKWESLFEYCFWYLFQNYLHNHTQIFQYYKYWMGSFLQ